MQQIYRRTLMPKCDFNKVDLHCFATLLKSHFSMGVPVNLLHIFKTLFLKNTSEWLLLIFLLLHCFNVRHKSKLAQKSCEIPGNSCSKVFKTYYIIKRFVNYFEYAILSLPNLLVYSLNTTSV